MATCPLEHLQPPALRGNPQSGGTFPELFTCYAQILHNRGAFVSDSETDSLARLRKAGFCPNCGKSIVKGTTVVRGAGSFCTLECVASYYGAEFQERARRLALAARDRH
jgi:hypothetical protein